MSFRPCARALGACTLIALLTGMTATLWAQAAGIILTALDFNKPIILVADGVETALGTTSSAGSASIALDPNKNYVLTMTSCQRYIVVVEDSADDRNCRAEESQQGEGGCERRCRRLAYLRGGKMTWLPGVTPRLPGQPSSRSWNVAVIGGGFWSTSRHGIVTLPQLASDEPAPGSRIHRAIASALLDPYGADLEDVLILLGELDNLDQELQTLDRAFSEFGLAGAALSAAVRLSFITKHFGPQIDRSPAGLPFAMRGAEPSSLRVYVEGGWSAYTEHQAFENGALQAKAESVHAAIRDGLLRANPSSVTSLAATSSGGYRGVLHIGGGIEKALGASFAGFQPAARVGFALGMPIGDPRVQNFSLDYGFSSGETAYTQRDRATLTSHAGTSKGVDGGVSLTRRIGRLDAVVDIGVRVQKISAEISVSTDPSTTSNQPGAILFATPEGSRTIIVSTLPGINSTLRTKLDDHLLWNGSGWRMVPVVRFGVVF